MNWFHLASRLFRSTKRSKAPRRGLFLESLEERTTPAVTALVNLGVLQVTATGSAFNDELRFRSEPGFAGRVSVTGLSGTAVNGTVNGSFTANGINAIRVDLGEGDDSVFLDNLIINGNFGYHGRNGANKLRMENNSFIGGSLNVVYGTNTTGLGSVVLDSSSNVGLNLNINHGLGNSQDILTGRIGGNVSIVGLSTTAIPGNNTVEVSDLVVGGAMTLNLANGDNELIGVIGRITVGRGVVYTGGLGSDEVILSNWTIGGGLATNLGHGTNLLSISTFGTSSTTIGAKLTYTGGSGTDTVQLTNNMRVGSGVSLTLGGATNSVTLDSAYIGGGLAVTGNHAGNTFRADDFTIAGSLSATFGNGANVFRLASTTNSSTASRIGGALVFNSGLGNDSVFLGQNAALTIVGKATINTSPAKPVLVSGAVVTDADTVTIDNTLFAASLTIFAGLGTDTVNLDSTVAGTNGVLIGGALFIHMGASDDTLVVGNSSNLLQHFVRMTSKPVFIGGGGTDTITLLTGGGLQGPTGLTVLPTLQDLTLWGWEITK